MQGRKPTLRGRSACLIPTGRQTHQPAPFPSPHRSVVPSGQLEFAPYGCGRCMGRVSRTNSCLGAASRLRNLAVRREVGASRLCFASDFSPRRCHLRLPRAFTSFSLAFPTKRGLERRVCVRHGVHARPRKPTPGPRVNSFEFIQGSPHPLPPHPLETCRPSPRGSLFSKVVRWCRARKAMVVDPSRALRRARVAGDLPKAWRRPEHAVIRELAPCVVPSDGLPSRWRGRIHIERVERELLRSNRNPFLSGPGFDPK